MNFLPSQVLRGDVEVKEGQTQHGHCPCANVCAVICHQYTIIDTIHNNLVLRIPRALSLRECVCIYMSSIYHY